MIKKNNGIDILTKELDSEKLACNKYNTEISTLKSSISNLELQINALNGQNNLLVISNNDKASLINDKQDELAMLQHRIGGCEGAKAQLEETIKLLRVPQNQVLPNINNNQEQTSPPTRAIVPIEDVFILHDFQRD